MYIMHIKKRFSKNTHSFCGVNSCHKLIAPDLDLYIMVLTNQLHNAHRSLIGHAQTVGFWPRPGRIRPRTKRIVVEYTGDVPVSTGMLPPEFICSWVVILMSS